MITDEYHQAEVLILGSESQRTSLNTVIKSRKNSLQIRLECIPDLQLKRGGTTGTLRWAIDKNLIRVCSFSRRLEDLLESKEHITHAVFFVDDITLVSLCALALRPVFPTLIAIPNLTTFNFHRGIMFVYAFALITGPNRTPSCIPEPHHRRLLRTPNRPKTRYASSS